VRLGDSGIAVRNRLGGCLAHVPGAAAARPRLIRHPGRLLAGMAEAGAFEAGAPVAPAG
jgi:hypothetical protein